MSAVTRARRVSKRLGYIADPPALPDPDLELELDDVIARARAHVDTTRPAPIADPPGVQFSGPYVGAAQCEFCRRNHPASVFCYEV